MFAYILDTISGVRSNKLASTITESLSLAPLTIVDVGAAMGISERWAALGGRACRFITFEADPRSTEEAGPGFLTFSSALGDKKGTQTLHLTKAPFASSLLIHNKDLLDRFGVREWHEPAGELEVSVDRLDECLASVPDWQPDFIKVDAEGADLAVLKGAEHTLQNVLGIQVEVAFAERHVNTPFFSDIDGFLRARNFALFQLIREHWLRRNGLFGPESRPQLIWGDAIYFRDLPAFRTRIKQQGDRAQKKRLLVKFIALLLVYGCHDYALEVVDDLIARDIIERDFYEDLISAISECARGPVLFVPRAILTVGLVSAVYAVSLLLGRRVRERASRLLRREAMPLFHYLYRNSARTGLARSCITDNG